MYEHSRTARTAVHNARRILQRRRPIPEDRRQDALQRLEAEIAARGLNRPGRAPA